MSDLEELRRRKEELELQRQIARLERREQIGSAAERVKDRTARWSWWVVGPLTFIGGIFTLHGFGNGGVPSAIFGLALLLPVLAKLRF